MSLLDLIARVTGFLGGLLFFATIAYVPFVAVKDRGLRRRLRRLPVRPCADLRSGSGPVLISGRAAGATTPAPLSGTPAVWHRVAIWHTVDTGEGNSNDCLWRHDSAPLFAVDDRTGVASVRAELLFRDIVPGSAAAVMRTMKSPPDWLDRLRRHPRFPAGLAIPADAWAEEHTLPHGAPVTVLGRLSRGTVHPSRRHGGVTADPVAGLRRAADEQDRGNWSLVRLTAVGAVVLLAVSWLARQV